MFRLLPVLEFSGVGTILHGKPAGLRKLRRDGSLLVLAELPPPPPRVHEKDAEASTQPDDWIEVMSLGS